MNYDFEERLKSVIKGCFGEVDTEELGEETNLIDDYDATSIDIIQIIVNLEIEFNIVFPDEYLVIEKIAPYKELVSTMKVLLCDSDGMIEDDEI